MCIAILKPIGQAITTAALLNSFRSNRDGAGYAFVTPENKMHIVKDVFKDFEVFLARYREDEEKYGAQSPALIHFRIATGSNVDQENCHPFALKHGALIHNGWFFPSTKEKSDTNLMASAISSWMNYTAAQNGLVALNKHFANNKVIVLFKDRRWVIFNEALGDWVDGVWYSNTAWKGWGTARDFTPRANTHVSGAVHAAMIDNDDGFDFPGACHMGHRQGRFGQD
jgi:hypothetical protein